MTSTPAPTIIDSHAELFTPSLDSTSEDAISPSLEPHDILPDIRAACNGIKESLSEMCASLEFQDETDAGYLPLMYDKVGWLLQYFDQENLCEKNKDVAVASSMWREIDACICEVEGLLEMALKSIERE